MSELSALTARGIALVENLRDEAEHRIREVEARFDDALTYHDYALLVSCLQEVKWLALIWKAPEWWEHFVGNMQSRATLCGVCAVLLYHNNTEPGNIMDAMYRPSSVDAEPPAEGVAQ